METPDTRYAKAPDGAFVAYQVFGSGPVDILLLLGYLSNVDENWRMPEMASVLRRIGEFARVIIMDRRGVGLSDRLTRGDVEPLETHVDDLVSVLESVHVASVFVVATEGAAPLALLFTAAHPARTHGLVLYSPIAVSPTRLYDDVADPLGPSLAERNADDWGTTYAEYDLQRWAPSVAGDADVVRRWGAYLRASASPTSALAVFDQFWTIDARDVYASVHVPTLVMYRPDADHDAWISRLAHDAMSRLSDARLVELPGRDFPFWWGDPSTFVAELEEFVTGSRVVSSADGRRGLCTVLFTDIVRSTEYLAAVGDQAWAEVLARHHAIVRGAIDRHRGVEVDVAGDGFLATFDGPARAVRAALEASRRVEEELDIQIRSGVHTGEVEWEGRRPKGLAVHIGARVASCAPPSEVWASSTVRDLVAGSGLAFEDAGEHELKGVPDHWRLYRVID